MYLKKFYTPQSRLISVGVKDDKMLLFLQVHTKSFQNNLRLIDRLLYPVDI